MVLLRKRFRSCSTTYSTSSAKTLLEDSLLLRSNTSKCGGLGSLSSRRTKQKRSSRMDRLSSLRVAGYRQTRTLPTMKILFLICNWDNSSYSASSVFVQPLPGTSVLMDIPLPHRPSLPTWASKHNFSIVLLLNRKAPGKEIIHKRLFGSHLLVTRVRRNRF